MPDLEQPLPGGATPEAVAAPLGRADVRDAAQWLAGRVVRTPVLRSPAIDRLAGARILFKAEPLQHGGSYEMRGAMLAVGRLAAAGTHPGVAAQSAGTHAAAVALAARRLGLAATVVLPVQAPAALVAKARDAGATVLLVAGGEPERRAVVQQVRAASGYAVIDADDHRDVVVGHGTASLELIEQAHRLGASIDALVLPAGGGGGVAGACLAAGDTTHVYAVESLGRDWLARSLAVGRRVPVAAGPTPPGGVQPSGVGALLFDILRTSVSGVVRVDDAASARAFRLVLFHLKVLVEPPAAAALAGALRIAARGPHRTIGVVLTGGNVEPDTVARLMTDWHAGVQTLAS